MLTKAFVLPYFIASYEAIIKFTAPRSLQASEQAESMNLIPSQLQIASYAAALSPAIVWQRGGNLKVETVRSFS